MQSTLFSYYKRKAVDSQSSGGRRPKPPPRVYNGESQLPQSLIHRIQSFLNAKEAAQTTVLSKRWRKAWLTRPNLNFDETYFPRVYYDLNDEFKEFAMETIKRYEESNLKIESLRIFLGVYPCHIDCNFAKELIVKALKMGASDIFLRVDDHEFVLPPDVFGAENLVKLYAEGCTIDLEQIGDPTVIKCSKLKSLCLNSVDITRKERFSYIISSCPLIEILSLCSIYGSLGMNLIFLQHKLHNLKRLLILGLTIDPVFFSDLSSKFPSLEALTLQLGDCREKILISSRSLERVNFQQCGWRAAEKLVEFDVPSILKFTFDGSVVPRLSFKSASREWESHVTLRHESSEDLDTWFIELSKLLTELNSSRIHITISHHSKLSFYYDVGPLEDLPRPLVENLTLEIEEMPSLSSYAIFDGLFRLCRPKIITQYVPPESSFGDDFLCKTLVRRMDEKLAMRRHLLYGLHDVEEVNAQLFDEVVAEWRDLPWKTFLDAPTSKKRKQTMRFQLKWKP